MAKKKIKNRYNSRFYRYVPSVIFGLAGLFYAFSPYQIKLAAGLDFGNTPQEHMIFGAVFVSIAALFWWAGRNRK